MHHSFKKFNLNLSINIKLSEFQIMPLIMQLMKLKIAKGSRSSQDIQSEMIAKPSSRF